MPNIDLKFYFAVFLRRLPYFLVIATLVIVVAVMGAQTLAFALLLVLAIVLPLTLDLAGAFPELLLALMVAVVVITGPAGER